VIAMTVTGFFNIVNIVSQYNTGTGDAIGANLI
jgi:hypothetical protein